MSCHWEATEIRSAADGSATTPPGDAGGRVSTGWTGGRLVRSDPATTAISASAEQPDPRIEPHQDQVRDEDAGHRQDADEHHDRAREEHVLRQEGAQEQRPD